MVRCPWFVAGILSLVIGRKLGFYFFATSLIGDLAYIVVTVLFYVIFKPVNKAISLVAAVVSLVGCVLGLLEMFDIITLPINNLVFFGFYCLLIGYLIFRSSFLPRILGVLLALGGLGWLTFASPLLTKTLAPYNFAPGILAERLLMILLIAAGLD